MGCFSGNTVYQDKLRALTSSALSMCVDALCERYEIIERGELAHSILGKSIPLLKVGKGDKAVLYVGAHHGMEWITSVLLLYFLDELCDAYVTKRQTVGLTMDFVFKSRSLIFVPMLNPDGVDLAILGKEAGGILLERQIRMNGDNEDFSRWQANARGVDLNHNYQTGFVEYKRLEQKMGIPCGAPTRYSGDSPESEPESAALANLVRTLFPHSIYTLHTQGEEIYCGGGEGVGERILSVGRTLSGLSGYRLAIPNGSAAYGGLTDYAVRALGIPSFTIECGKGENPLPPSSALLLYATLRRMLFYSTIL